MVAVLAGDARDQVEHRLGRRLAVIAALDVELSGQRAARVDPIGVKHRVDFRTADAQRAKE